MKADLDIQWNGKQRGFYEVFFFLLNDPSQALALWLRWVVVSPKIHRHAPQASVWGVVSRAGQSAEAMRETFNADQLQSIDAWRVGGVELRDTGALGQLGEGRLQWDLTWDAVVAPQRLFPADWMYRMSWPKTKAASPGPLLQASGHVVIDGQTYNVNNAHACLGHFWGTQMAERWAWMQCNTFAEDASATLEALSASIAVGPCKTPAMTLLQLYTHGQRYPFNQACGWLRHRTQWNTTGWELEASHADYRLMARCQAPKASMVGLTYTAPDNSRRYCYHTDFANVSATLSQRKGSGWKDLHTLTAAHTVRFETVSRAPEPDLPLQI